MKNLYLSIFLVCTGTLFVQAGNPERAGQAGATQLLINSWARSSGMNGMNYASGNGIEALGTNPAGLATTRRTELVFAHSRWLVGSDIGINSFGLSQGLKRAGVLGLFVNAFDMGEFERTTPVQAGEILHYKSILARHWARWRSAVFCRTEFWRMSAKGGKRTLPNVIFEGGTVRTPFEYGIVHPCDPGLSQEHHLASAQ